ncbi:KipI antagonist [Yeosuana aromativorans]|uniref:KipI antagonist n=1 Tax=Yeosuana aromativorans TaxID=288019 RepID=A0A8J3BJY0_9FLAO|nr:biotin-dependent carboxyltransferase family protein [Yeosuana aromativorans]GGK15886.1 KipI antagonist [Yeosuana aromativorans]
MVEVVKAGFYDTIQDLGRAGFQHYGVPYSGVMDMYAAALANSLLGNDLHASVMEITMTGPVLKFHCNTNICLSGADMSPTLNSQSILNNTAIAVKTGDVLSFGKLRHGFRCYLAVSEGFKTETVMNSFSMYKGITTKHKLDKNDRLPISESVAFKIKNASLKIDDSYLNTNIVEVFEGPEFHHLSKQQKKVLFSKEFAISKYNSRMAYQLVETLDNTLKPIITSLVLPGTVQLTPAGKLIVLMKDCQTTGGYPRVLQLKESALDVLAQKFSGNPIRFQLID